MKKYKLKSIEELQEEVELNRVCDALGMESVEETPVYKCPFCDGDNFVTNDIEYAKKYYCFDCEAKGDALDLLTGAWRQSEDEALHFLSIMFNSVLVEHDNDVERELEKEKIKERKKHVDSLLSEQLMEFVKNVRKDRL